ncbi:MAG: methylenetetrahydrofolate reductase [Deltaproteobacteria bacterium]|nr:methylenetetrahydrofolate reductase [Deltaproteobacteria bacterium]
MFDYPYLVEMLSPKRSTDDQIEGFLDRFAERFRKVIHAGCGISIPDNPMGQPRLGALESIDLVGLSVDPEKVVMNLNTFHNKSELDGLLQKAAEANLKYILVIRGDGGPLLPKLDSKSIGGKLSVATSIDLIRYINKDYPDQFITGAAFNPYKPMPFELNRMKQKIDAGAKYVVTQPIIGKDENVCKLEDFNIAVVVEAWMSNNIDLLYKSVGKEKDEKAEKYDPLENLKALHESYPECCVYLSMLSFKQDWQEILPRLSI